jgi:peroxiredoxin
LPDLKRLDASLVAISPQLPSFLLELKTQSNLGFDLLFDRGCAVAATFGVAMHFPPDLIDVYRRIKVDLEVYNGDTLWRLPAPARIVVDRHGIVRHIDTDPDYTRRPEPSETVAVVAALG